MLLGPKEILECPSCKTLFSLSTIRSGNSFGAVRWSDSKIDAPMLPSSPRLIRCHGCSKFFWVNELIEIGKYNWDETPPFDWKNATPLSHLSLAELLEFLGNKQELTLSQEYYVRIRVHWEYNDPIRLGKLHSIPDASKIEWHMNIERLFQTFDWNNHQNRLLAAELIRNLEEWDLAIDILNTITEPSLNYYRLKIQEKCIMRDNLVFMF